MQRAIPLRRAASGKIESRVKSIRSKDEGRSLARTANSDGSGGANFAQTRPGRWNALQPPSSLQNDQNVKSQERPIEGSTSENGLYASAEE